MRRCVIDLSDSEDDSSLGGTHKGTGGNYEYGFEELPRLRPLTPIVVQASPQAGGVGTPPIVTLASGSVGNMSPAALIEKEQEIRRMRELIAQREQNRLKKLAMVCPVLVVLNYQSMLILYSAVKSADPSCVSTSIVN